MIQLFNLLPSSSIGVRHYTYLCPGSYCTPVNALSRHSVNTRSVQPLRPCNSRYNGCNNGYSEDDEFTVVL